MTRISPKNELCDGKKLSEKQKAVFNWWCSAPTSSRDGIICDGAIRSGKTFSMSVSFVIWASLTFSRSDFAFCGKTITSVRRNLITPLMRISREWGFTVKDFPSKNYAEITLGGKTNRFYLFGGRDESSAALIQGMTLSGIMLDETALMPRSFVEQAVARCSADKSKLWFNCNPEHKLHWFKREWIDKAAEKNLLYLHFDLEDNPSLSPEVIGRYKKLYSGVFYERFVLGKWVSTEGLVYPMFSEEKHVVRKLPDCFASFAVSCDYGTVNPSSFGLWGLNGGIWYRIAEYYYDSRREGMQRTDEEHYKALEELCGSRSISQVICDPSAASFIECIRRHGRFRVLPAKNDVLSGIRRTADALSQGKIKISASCTDCIREFSLYRWDRSGAVDAPLKENDHAMDDLRYFVSRMLAPPPTGFFVASTGR
ncbi:MAG: PBSX family phage terminase large subunit [Ruminococcus sp.]|nr:PBSX family phage terminase large subunit [Ruminococcus sp.]